MFKSPDVFLRDFPPFLGGFDFGPFVAFEGDTGFFCPNTSYFCHMVKILSRSSHISPVRNASWNSPSHLDSVSRTSGLLSLIHISEPTRLGMISYAVFCLKK